MRIKFKTSSLSCLGRNFSDTRVRHARSAGMTLIEVVVSTAIMAVVFGGVISGYIQSGLRVQWSGYSMAAQSMATEVMEQAKSGIWDPTQATPINSLTNLNLLSPSYNTATKTYTGYSTGILDVPYSGTNFTLATNYVSVQMVYLSGFTNVQMQSIRVDTVWPFAIRAQNLYFTNTVCTLMAPDNRGPNTF
jgi:prepilin-type N-terminal cleavage/methylation domain-containing protein